MRIFFEAKLVALHAFYQERLAAAPDRERSQLSARASALKAAMRLPESQLPVLLVLADRFASNSRFGSLVLGVCSASDPARPCPVLSTAAQPIAP